MTEKNLLIGDVEELKKTKFEIGVRQYEARDQECNVKLKEAINVEGGANYKSLRGGLNEVWTFPEQNVEVRLTFVIVDGIKRVEDFNFESKDTPLYNGFMPRYDVVCDFFNKVWRI